MSMLWFNVSDSNFTFLCFKQLIIHYHTEEQRKIKFLTMDKIEPHQL